MKTKIKKVKQKITKFKEYVSTIGKPKILFVWIPKNAGTSFFEALQVSINMKVFLKVKDIKRSFTNGGSVTFGHIGVAHLLDEKIISDGYYKKSFVFCICRNPYDRFVSLYHYLKKQNRIPSDYDKLDLMNAIVKGIPPVGLYNFEGISQCNPQVDWIAGIKIDRILRFEDLSSDAHSLSQELGFEIELPHVNQSEDRKKFYKELDKETIVLIQNFYKVDFERFNYSMELE